MKIRFVSIAATAFGLLISPLAALADTANYSVPVAADLAPFATFKLQNFKASFVPGEKAKMRFSLPPELVGRYSPTIRFREDTAAPASGTAKVLRSEYGTAVCEKDVCAVTYLRLPNSLEGATKFLQDTVLDPVQLNARLEVAKAFSGDPIGVIEIISARTDRD